MRQTQDNFKILNAAAATGAGLAMDVADFQHIVLAVDTAGSANFTLKIQGSISDAKPNFAAAASPTNQWAYVQIINLADQTTVNGATGVTSAGTDVDNMYEVNVNGLRWLTGNITAYAAGAVTLAAKTFSNQ